MERGPRERLCANREKLVPGIAGPGGGKAGEGWLWEAQKLRRDLVSLGIRGGSEKKERKTRESGGCEGREGEKAGGRLSGNGEEGKGTELMCGDRVGQQTSQCPSRAGPYISPDSSVVQTGRLD